MTNMKRLAGLLLALVMLLAMAAPAMAEETTTYTLTLKNALPGHTYTAYQIFTGDLHEGILSNIVWGDGVTEEGQAALGNAAEKADSIKNAEAAAAFAEAVAPYLTAAAGSVIIADDADTGDIENLEAGYYLVQTTGVTETDSAYTKYIMIVVEDTEVKIKSSVPTVEKKVDDINDSNDTEVEIEWQDSADYDIGDAVPYKLTANLADNVEAYETYSIKFVDTLTAGLTYNADAVVKFGETDVTEHFTIALDAETNVLTVSCDDVKAFGATNSSVIDVYYTATLNENAVIGAAGNPNTVYLEYSNNPNSTGEGDNDSTGRTPEDKVTVFTFKVIVNKTDAENKPLAGAGFTLYKKTPAGEYVAIGEELKLDADGIGLTTFEWTGLDAGDYKLEETTTPAGYNTIDAIEFTITATHDVESDNPQLLTLTGDVAGVIVAEGEEAEAIFNVAHTEGTLTTDVMNTTGATLPSTGGMGTTVIYIAGGALVLVAIIILVAKKRAGSEK